MAYPCHVLFQGIINIVKSTIITKHLNGTKFKKELQSFCSKISKKPHLIYSSHSLHYIVIITGIDHNFNEYNSKSLRSIRIVKSLKNIRMRNMNIIILGHLNSLKNKLDSLTEQD